MMISRRTTQAAKTIVMEKNSRQVCGSPNLPSVKKEKTPPSLPTPLSVRIKSTNNAPKSGSTRSSAIAMNPMNWHKAAQGTCFFQYFMP